jgi:hypothetical protein
MAPRRTSRRLTTRTSRPIASNGGGRRVSHRGGADVGQEESDEARETESPAQRIYRDGQPLTVEEWLGGAQIQDPVDVRYAENELLARERAADEAAPPWRPGFEPKRSSKRRR